MPQVQIEILKGRPAAERRHLLDAVHEALVQAFSIPEDDRTQRIVEHDSENFEIPPGASELYMLIEITAFPGRSATAKRRLYEAIVHNLETVSVPAKDISIVLHEPLMRELWYSWWEAGQRSGSRLPRGRLTLRMPAFGSLSRWHDPAMGSAFRSSLDLVWSPDRRSERGAPNRQ
jgi:hypothetical protein